MLTRRTAYFVVALWAIPAQADPIATAPRAPNAAQYQRYAAKVRRAFRVDRARAPKVIGVFDAIDTLRARSPEEYARLVGMLGKLAFAGYQAKGLSADQAEVRANQLMAHAKAGRVEMVVDRALRIKPEAMKRYLKALYDPNMPFRDLLPQSTGDYQLPREVNLDRFSELVPTMPVPQSKVDVAFGPLVRAGVANAALKTEEGKRRYQGNVVLAETLHRLAENQHVATGEAKLAVTYGGRQHTHLRSFLRALRRTGHKVRVRYTHQDADFMRARLLGAEDGLETGNYLNVAAGLQTYVSVKTPGDVAQSRAVAHSEMRVDIEGPVVNGAAIGYQGIGGRNGHVGFFPADGGEPNGWSGHTVVDQVRDSDRAVREVVNMGLYMATVNEFARSGGYGMGAYGAAPGVCNDSMAVAQYMARRKVTGYPLAGSDQANNGLDALVGQLIRNPATTAADRHVYRRMHKALAALGRDRSTDEPTRAVDRYLQSPLDRSIQSLPDNPVLGANIDLLAAFVAARSEGSAR